jgi:hypothetical protein
MRSRGGCLALVPKSPVNICPTHVAGSHFRPALALNIPPRIALDGWLVDLSWVTLTNSV